MMVRGPLEVPATPCPLCGGRLAPERGFAVEGERYGYCPPCHARVLIPFPDSRRREAFYRETYHAVFGAADASARRQTMLRHLLAAIPRQPPGRLLDVGCGTGHLLALARSAGWDVAGVDPSAEGCSQAQARYGIEVQATSLETADLPAASIDVVTLVNVLDQAPDPVRLLEAAHRVLRPGGLLVARVPNGDFHRLAWGMIRHLPAPAAHRFRPLVIFHPVCLNARALRALLARAGFGPVRIAGAPISGDEWSVPRGIVGRAALAGMTAAARAGAGIAARITAGRLVCAPSLLALGDRGDA